MVDGLGVRAGTDAGADVAGQFVVLQRTVLTRADGSQTFGFDVVDEEGVAQRPRKRVILRRILADVPHVVALIFALVLSVAVCFGPIIFLRATGWVTVEELRAYELSDPDAEPEWPVEALRTAILSQVVLGGLVVVHYTGGMARSLATWAARNAAPETPADMRLFTAKGAAVLESAAAVWPHLGRALVAAVLWLLSWALLPYRLAPASAGPRRLGNMPRFFYAERALLVACAWLAVLALEKTLIHRVARQFNAPLYQERIARFLRAMWALDVLRKAAAAFAYRPRAPSLPHFARLWAPRTYPWAGTGHAPHAMLEAFVALGTKTAERDAAAARRLFRFLASSPAAGLRAPDLEPFFAPQGEGAAVFSAVFDPAGTGAVSARDFARAIEEVYAERATLVSVLVANTAVLASLDRLLIAVLLGLLPIILFLATGFSVSDTLGLASLGPVLSVIVFHSRKTVERCVAAIVFLFVTHPYDVGDRVYIAPGCTSYFVRQLGLLSTTFERWDGYIVAWPNSLLAGMPMCNVRRTATQAQVLELVIPAIVPDPAAAVEGLQRSLSAWVDTQPADFVSVRVVPFELRRGTQLVLLVVLRHRMSFQDGALRVVRYMRFTSRLASLVQEMGLDARPAIRPLAIGGASPDVDPFVEECIARLELNMECHVQQKT